MVRVVRTPAVFRERFSANQLSGWVDGIEWTPVLRRRKKRKERTLPLPSETPRKASRVSVGRSLKIA
jgi:hypothetical protein